MVFASVSSSSPLPVAVARTSQSPFPLAVMLANHLQYNKPPKILKINLHLKKITLHLHSEYSLTYK